MIIAIKNLRIRAIIGFNGWEREKKQDLIVNLEMDVPDESAAQTDNVEDSVDYKTIKHTIVDECEQTDFNLIEKLAGFILDIVMRNPKVQTATVEVDKPHALRFADSVSVTLTRTRENEK